MELEIHTRQMGAVLVVTLEGELDAYWAEETQRELWDCLEQGHHRLVLDLSRLTYLSSAGLRVLLQLHKRVEALGGQVHLASLQPFVRQVLAASGFDHILSVFDAVDQALAVASPVVTVEDDWATAETHATPTGSFWFRPGEAGAARLRVVGQADDFLYSRASPERLATLSLDDLGYMLGVGALGEAGPAVLDRLGELVTVPGAVYWLPGDGRQVPDFLVTKEGKARLPVHLLYGLALEGPPQVYGRFTASDPQAGASLGDLIRDVLAWASGAKEYTGVIGLVLRAEVAGLWGVGLKRSPQVERAPANGQRISHRENIKDWLHFPTEPTYANHTMLAVGVLVERTPACLPADLLQAAFGTPEPGPDSAQGGEAHLHGAVFRFVPELGGPHGLEAELDHVVQQGELVNVLHLLPNSCLRKALFGLMIVGTLERWSL
jgi:anti-anti-sigma factor